MTGPVSEIIATVTARTGVSYAEIRGKSRRGPITRARQVLSYCIGLKTGLSSTQIARIVGYASHASVLRDRANIPYYIEHDRCFRAAYYSVVEEVRNMEPGKRKTVYVAHPIGGDVEGNMAELLKILRRINLEERNVVPCAPYVADVLSLRDEAGEEREKGLRNCEALIATGMFDELRVYGGRITEGIGREIAIAEAAGIPVVFYK